MDILVHACCGPCYIYPAKITHQKFKAPVAFYYNPNIYPLSEYEKRLAELSRFVELEKHELYVLKDAGLDYIESVYQKTAKDQDELGDEDLDLSIKDMEHDRDRCRKCYEFRLDKTAQTAKRFDAKAFTTTLLVSPYQDHDYIKKIGGDIAERRNIEFFYEDFRVGYRESVEISRSAGMYRQRYCGCKASLIERSTAKR